MSPFELNSEHAVENGDIASSSGTWRKKPGRSAIYRTYNPTLPRLICKNLLTTAKHPLPQIQESHIRSFSLLGILIPSQNIQYCNFDVRIIVKMHYFIMAYLLLTFSIGKLAFAFPAAAVKTSTTTILAAAASTSTAPLRKSKSPCLPGNLHLTYFTARVTAKNDLDKAGKPITVPALEAVTYNTGDLIKVIEQRAWSLKSREECRDLCWITPSAIVDKSLPNCLGGSYDTWTELCQLAFNAQLVEGMERTQQCPLGWITYAYIPVEKAGERKGSKHKRDGDVKGKAAGEEEGYDHDGGIRAPCLDQGLGAM